MLDMTTKRRRISVNHMSLADMIDRMLIGPCSVGDLVDATGLHRQTLYRLVNALVARNAAHKAGKRPDSLGRASTTLFALGRKA